MANTVVVHFMATGRTDWELRLTNENASTVLNNSPSGDVLAEGAPGQYVCTIDEALSGAKEAGLFDDNGDCRGRFKIKLADDVGPYYTEEPSSVLAEVVDDTNELQADWADGGRLYELLDAAAAGGGGGGGDCPTLPQIVSALSGQELTVHTPVAEDGTLTLWQGDGYEDEDLLITIDDFTEEDPATYEALTFGLMLTSEYEAGTGESVLEVDATGELTSGVATFAIELTSEQTDALTPSPALDPYNYTYQLLATYHGGKKRTIASGAATIKRKVVQ